MHINYNSSFKTLGLLAARLITTLYSRNRPVFHFQTGSTIFCAMRFSNILKTLFSDSILEMPCNFPDSKAFKMAFSSEFKFWLFSFISLILLKFVYMFVEIASLAAFCNSLERSIPSSRALKSIASIRDLGMDILIRIALSSCLAFTPKISG